MEEDQDNKNFNHTPKRPRLGQAPSLPPLHFADREDQNHGSNLTTKNIQIPFLKSADLIGYDGKNLKKLEYIAGATIKVNPDPFTLKGNVELIGTLEQIKVAEVLIGAMVEESGTSSR